MRSKNFLVFFLLGVVMLAVPVASHAQIAVGISVRIGPPPLPVYVQPVCPAPGYIWTPGYWAYGPDGYFWVPGTWVEPPVVGVLWTPGYWGWRNGFYVWNAGYWGQHVGFYGGINYGFGYTGVGFVGGFWRGGVYSYNRAVTNVNVTIIHNTYNATVINNTTVNRVSYNGGAGGTMAQPTIAEQNAARERHFEATGMQMQHEKVASTNRAQFASVNGGKPAVAASPKPGVLSGQGVVAGNKNAGFQKFSRNNSTPPQSGSGNVARGGSNTTSTNTNFASKGSGPNRMMHGSNSSSAPSKTYQTDARIKQNNPSANNSHDHGQTGSQHSHGKEPRPDKR